MLKRTSTTAALLATGAVAFFGMGAAPAAADTQGDPVGGLTQLLDVGKALGSGQAPLPTESLPTGQGAPGVGAAPTDDATAQSAPEDLLDGVGAGPDLGSLDLQGLLDQAAQVEPDQVDVEPDSGVATQSAPREAQSSPLGGDLPEGPDDLTVVLEDAVAELERTGGLVEEPGAAVEDASVDAEERLGAVEDVTAADTGGDESVDEALGDVTAVADGAAADLEGATASVEDTLGGLQGSGLDGAGLPGGNQVAGPAHT